MLLSLHCRLMDGEVTGSVGRLHRTTATLKPVRLWLSSRNCFVMYRLLELAADGGPRNAVPQSATRYGCTITLFFILSFLSGLRAS
jgi:hypothetical protein